MEKEIIMTAIEILIIILVAFAVAARIAGARFFDGLGDVRATADGIRCRMASWVFFLVTGFLALLNREFSMTVNVVGGICVVVSFGGLKWEYLVLMNYTRDVVENRDPN
jgi:hypothetical protein